MRKRLHETQERLELEHIKLQEAREQFELERNTNLDLDEEVDELQTELEQTQMQLASLQEDADRLMEDGAYTARAILRLKQQVQPVMDLVTPIDFADPEDVESRLDRLYGLRSLLNNYAQQLMSARMHCRNISAAKRKAEHEEEHQCTICCDACLDCVLPCQHKFCFSCVSRLDTRTCPHCRAPFNVVTKL